MQTRLIATFAVVVSLIGTPVLAEAPEVTLRLHHFLPPQSNTQVTFLEPWVQRVEEESGGRIRIEIYPSMTLGGKPQQLFDQARTGVADIVWTLPGYTPGRFPLVEVFELPFVTGSAEATSQAVMDFYDDHLTEEFAEVHPLVLHVHAPGVIHTRETPIAAIEDMVNVPLRAPTRQINAALAALGAEPVGMPVPQVPEAVSKGIVEGALVPYEVTLALRLPELTRHHIESGLYTAVFLLAMNKGVYDRLPDDLRTVIDNNAGLATAAWAGGTWDANEAEARQIVADGGGEIVVLSDEEEQRWREATQPVIDAWIAEMDAAGHDGKALYDDAVRLVEHYSE
ncbi:MAG: TRAP transporter substrate-binding protein [Rhodospirillales bacterium]|nr:TRAP transporter substrate-binding protein [Rhodospirillales bacterium]